MRKRTLKCRSLPLCQLVSSQEVEDKGNLSHVCESEMCSSRDFLLRAKMSAVEGCRKVKRQVVKMKSSSAPDVNP